MDMDKSWINLTNRRSNQYQVGLEMFLDFVFDNNMGDTRIYCPSKKCYNHYFVARDEVRAHIIVDGFMPHYINWTHHGEVYHSVNSNRGIETIVGDDMFRMVHEAFGHPNLDSSFGND